MFLDPPKFFCSTRVYVYQPNNRKTLQCDIRANPPIVLENTTWTSSVNVEVITVLNTIAGYKANVQVNYTKTIMFVFSTFEDYKLAKSRCYMLPRDINIAECISDII